MPLVLKNLSDVLISEDELLNQDTLNSKMGLLVNNDRLIYNSFGNTIGRWHCYWYYNSNIKGYSKGDLVWLNVEDAEDFLRNHYEIIKTYTDLKPEILVKLPAFDPMDRSVINKYLNALSGYIDSKSSIVKPLEPIFDLGDASKPIQLAVSLMDNNKKLVSDESAWKKLFVDDNDSEEKIKDTIVASKDHSLEEHLLNYHLSGQEEYVEAQLSDYLDAPQSSYYDSALSTWYAKFNEKSDAKQYGIDYVTHFIHKPFLVSGEVSQYQAVRYWKSGWIEHFGTIATTNPMFSISGGSFLRIPFDWTIAGDGSKAKGYESGELAKTMYSVLSAIEDDSNLVPPKDNLINVRIERSTVEVNGSTKAIPFKNADYNVSISPVYQNQTGIEEEYIAANYGENSFKQEWNSNFLTNELIEQDKKQNYFQMRLDTRTLAPYISYYATGVGRLNG